MKTSLSHLPPAKQQELQHITKVICETLGDNCLMVILFGSHARGDWVEDEYLVGRVRYSYRSDFDIAIITRDTIEEVDWVIRQIERKIKQKEGLTTQTEIIIDNLDDVNEELELGRYFYSDIKKEGILLYDSKTVELAKPKKLSVAERKELARKDFEKWFKKGIVKFDTYLMSISKSEKCEEYLNQAAFMLHQATECFFITFLLVYTDYRPKTHQLREYLERAMAFDYMDDEIAKKFHQIFPRNTDREVRMFKLLSEAYIDARFKDSYKITLAELQPIARKVEMLRDLVKELSEDFLSRTEEIMDYYERRKEKLEE